MLVLAHTGITLGAAVLTNGVRVKSPEQLSLPGKISAWLADMARHIDIRLLFIGSMLPDIIDKPLGHIIFRDSISNGRIYAHTLLFFMIIAVSGLYLYRKRQQLWLLVVAFGVFMHLILDSMWEAPETALWPLYGFTFPREDYSASLDIVNGFLGIIKKPEFYTSELIGGVILIWFVVFLLRRGKFIDFLRHGKIG